MQNIFCTKCGLENSIELNFCCRCGTKINKARFERTKAPKIRVGKYLFLHLLIILPLGFLAIGGPLAFIPILMFGLIGRKRYQNSRVDSKGRSFCWILTAMLMGFLYIFPAIIGIKYFKEEMSYCKTKEEMKKTAWDIFFIGWYGFLIFMLWVTIIGIFIAIAIGPKKYDVIDGNGNKIGETWK